MRNSNFFRGIIGISCKLCGKSSKLHSQSLFFKFSNKVSIEHYPFCSWEFGQLFPFGIDCRFSCFDFVWMFKHILWVLCLIELILQNMFSKISIFNYQNFLAKFLQLSNISCGENRFLLLIGIKFAECGEIQRYSNQIPNLCSCFCNCVDVFFCFQIGFLFCNPTLKFVMSINMISVHHSNSFCKLFSSKMIIKNSSLFSW